MYILLSPSKSLDFATSYKRMPFGGHIPIFNTETKQLHTILKTYSAPSLASLMHISEKLSVLNRERFVQWNGRYNKQKITKELEKSFAPSLSVFTGDVYRGFELEEYSNADWKYADKHIGIISGFYGILSPLTYMKPYRLEMGTRIEFEIAGKQYKNLYEFWSDQVTSHVEMHLAPDEILLNLASQEYAKAVDFSRITAKHVTVDFKVKKGTVYKTVGILAKYARGEMANSIVRKRISEISDLKKLKPADFLYNKKLSTDDRLVFVR